MAVGRWFDYKFTFPRVSKPGDAIDVLIRDANGGWKQRLHEALPKGSTAIWKRRYSNDGIREDIEFRFIGVEDGTYYRPEECY